VTIVRDVFCREQIRGQYRPVLLPAGEIVNMLGRAGRPGQVSKGTGIVLIDRDRKNEVGDLVDLIREGRGGHVSSHLTIASRHSYASCWPWWSSGEKPPRTTWPARSSGRSRTVSSGPR
jgi:hypothetical protein